eukprot:scaffold17017_cov67-Phaeocystis_antarctica.AAC.2
MRCDAMCAPRLTAGGVKLTRGPWTTITLYVYYLLAVLEFYCHQSNLEKAFYANGKSALTPTPRGARRAAIGSLEAQRRRARHHPRPAVQPARATTRLVLHQRQQRAAVASDAGVAAAAEA